MRIERGPWVALAVGAASEHAVLRCLNAPGGEQDFSIGSPLLLDGSEFAPEIAAVTNAVSEATLPFRANVVALVCLEELPGLPVARSSARYEKPSTALTAEGGAAPNLTIVVPGGFRHYVIRTAADNNWELDRKSVV